MNGQASCRKSCEPYNFAKPQSCYKDLFCAKQRGCNGRLFDCGFYDADAWVCLSQNPERRYDWIEYEDGTRLGRKGQCASKKKSRQIESVKLFSRIFILQIKSKLIVGGVGYFGTVPTVFANVMHPDRIPIGFGL